MIIVIKNKYDADTVLKFQKESPKKCLFFFMERQNKYHGDRRLADFFQGLKEEIDLVVLYGKVARKHKPTVQNLTRSMILSM